MSVEIPIDGILDLHTFAPRDTEAVVNAYLDACVERGIFEVRIIHGKGLGVQRRIVAGVLERRDDVLEVRGGELHEGSWGATIARLRSRG